MSSLIEIKKGLFVHSDACSLVFYDGEEFSTPEYAKYYPGKPEDLYTDLMGIDVETVYQFTCGNRVEDNNIIEMFEAGLIAIEEDGFEINAVALFDFDYRIDEDYYQLFLDEDYKNILETYSGYKKRTLEFIYAESPYSDNVIVKIPFDVIEEIYWECEHEFSLRIHTDSGKQYIAHYEYELEDGRVINQDDEFEQLGFEI